MGTRLLEFGGIRLVINQSVVPVELESSPKDRSCLLLFAVQGYILYTKYVISRALSIDITFICIYM